MNKKRILCVLVRDQGNPEVTEALKNRLIASIPGELQGEGIPWAFWIRTDCRLEDVAALQGVQNVLESHLNERDYSPRF